MVNETDEQWQNKFLNQTFKNSYSITNEIYNNFISTFGDKNTLHMSDENAQKVGFKSKVMHGAILQGFLSHFIGMGLPFQNVVLLNVDIRFATPSYLGDTIQIIAKVDQVSIRNRIVVFIVTFNNETQNTIAARAKVSIQVFNNEK